MIPTSSRRLSSFQRLSWTALALAVSVAFGATLAAAAPKASDLVSAELVAEPRAVAPGKPFKVAVRLTMAEHWHTYWRNPGDSGLATEIAWTLPEGFKAGPILWPTPSRIPVSHLVNYGYEGETSLLVEITPPATLATGGSADIRAKVSYLVCERECIPGEADVSTRLPVVAADAPEAGADPSTRYIFAAARAALPTASPWPTRLEAAGDRLVLHVAAANLRPDSVTSAYLFPADETALEHAAPQILKVDGTGLSLTLPRSALSTGAAPAELAGILTLEESLGGSTVRQAFEIGSPAASAAPAAAGLAGAATPAADTSWSGLLQAIALAFLGGLVLNLMPCVFPVLSIKVLSLVRHSGDTPARIRLNGLAYAVGIVASFVALAAILLGIRAGGSEIGWGFQLQSPVMVAALAFLLMAVGLSLSGLVEFGTSLASLAGGISTRTGPSGSFATGVLAALVATPCTAPFMGAAIGYALTTSGLAALAVFVALGLGMAAPFLALTLRPSLLARLPRPGAWMETLKQVLAFPVYATVAWLIFVLSQQVGATGLFAALIGLVLVGFGLWAMRLAAASGMGWGRRIGRMAALASLVAVITIAWALEPVGTGQAGQARVAARGGEEAFTQARLDALRAQGRPVFVNMTAAWCITCLVNERTTLSTAAVKAAFAGADVAYLKGDWTNQNPEITRLLERHGRNGVPLYVLYPARGEGIVLPQILTEATVLDQLATLPRGAKRAAL